MSESPDKQFDAVFVAHRSMLLSKLVKMVGNPAVAEELTQESYLRVRQSISEGNAIDHLKGFLFQTGRNLALDHLRQVKRQARVMISPAAEGELALDEVPSSAPAPEQIVSSQRAVQSLVALLERLSERQRRVFVLNRVHGWSHARIAAHIGTSESTVQKDVRLVMALCIEHLRGKKK